VVNDEDRVNWVVEGKRDSEVASPVVEAKRDAAREWLQVVNNDSAVSDHWGYLLASESVVASASSWLALRRGAQTQWIVRCAAAADCADFKDTLGGSFE